MPTANLTNRKILFNTQKKGQTMTKRQQRQIYALNVSEPQMEALLALVTKQRKQLAKNLQEKGDAPDADRIYQKLTQLKGIEKALETSIYFHDKFYEANKKLIKEKRATLKKPERRAKIFNPPLGTVPEQIN